MNRDFAYEFQLLEEWARNVSSRLGGDKFQLKAKREHIMEDAILCSIFTIATNLPSGEVTEAVVEAGKAYKRGRRYFFIYDQEKRMLFLLFYPYYILCNGTR